MNEKEKSALKTVLMIEDDSDILFAVSLFLEGEGYTVYGAENGFVALQLLKEHGLPHFILLDMAMPVMDGRAFAKEFAAQYGSTVPIGVTTGAADAEGRAKDIVGAVGWLAKPYALGDLLRLVKKHER